jgi:hypothetical protein
VVLGTSDYNWKITLLQDKAYAKFKKDPTESVEHKTVFLLQKSLFAEEVCQQVLPQGSRPPRFYGLSKIHKPGVPLRSIVNTIGSHTYHLAQDLVRLLNGHMSHSPHHLKNSIEFVHVFEFIPSRH